MSSAIAVYEFTFAPSNNARLMPSIPRLASKLTASPSNPSLTKEENKLKQQ